MSDQQPKKKCSRPGCSEPAVATLTYAYSEQTAVVGPLGVEDNPHSWDLCDKHSSRITAPHGWELLRVGHVELDDDDLMGLAEAVGAGRATGELGSDVDPIDYEPTFDGSDPDRSNHPVFRMRRVADVRAARRAHLSVVPDEDSAKQED
ncbi:DUF3499 domain-containing protein [Corynebacterium phocae]|uniref:DUF3499 domain-containing protein n=1 Tax=Corynebacterium phocae TaxID=161895 RepID=UPI000952EB77|nr:DUF3499 domain-containing protein [Corynebacterium phocae]